MVLKNKLWILLLLIGIVATSCQRNYYTSKARGNSCGCPATKGM